MKKSLLILNLIFISSLCFAQENFLIGKWKYEKMPDHIEIDEQGLKMADNFFKDMTMSFDENNYTLFLMGKSENGTWTSVKETIYEFNSTKGDKYEVEIKKVSDNKIIFKSKDKEWQLIKLLDK